MLRKQLAPIYGYYHPNLNLASLNNRQASSDEESELYTSAKRQKLGTVSMDQKDLVFTES